jgi:uncharacterized membrane protein YgcG
VVLIGHVKRPRGGPKPYPPTPPPYLSPTFCQGCRRIGVGRGGAAVGHLLPPGLRPHSLTALTLHICQTPLSYLMGHPSIESTPLSEPWIQRLTCPPLKQRSLGGGGKKGGGWGGGSQGEGPGLVGGGERGGGWGERSICDLKHLLSWEKTQRTVLLVPSHFFPR